MKIGDLVKDSVHEIASANEWRCGIVVRMDKDYYGSHIQGKENRLLVMWNVTDALGGWEYCKTNELEVISEDR